MNNVRDDIDAAHTTMKKLKLLVTRQEPEATLTAQKLYGLGFDVAKMPLTQLVGLRPVLPKSPADVAIITSAAAINFADQSLLQAFAKTRTYCVGEKTRLAAEKAGFTAIVATFDTAKQLLQTANIPPDSSTVFLTGRVRRPIIEEGFSARKAQLTIVEIYDTVSGNVPAQTADYQTIDAVLIYSQTAADFLSKLVGQFPKGIKVFCLSQRIADRLNVSFQAVTAAPKPNEDSLLDAVLKWRDELE